MFEFYLKKIIKIIAIVVIFSFIGLAILVGTFSIKSNNIIENVKESAIVMKKEGIYPSVSKFYNSQLDNFTDSIMLLESVDDTNDTIINRALLSYRISYTNRNPHQTLIDKYISNIPESEAVKCTYARYWHGYLVLVKPLLLIGDYNFIRIVNAVFQFLVSIYLLVLMYKNGLKMYILPYVLTLLMLCPTAQFRSLQFSSCFYVFSLISCLIIKINQKFGDNFNWVIFAVSGILTSYFDFLTYPISTFGIPSIFYLIISSRKNKNNKITKLLDYLFCWFLGYGLMWSNKWIIASLLTKENVILNAINAFIYRTSGENISLIRMLGKNIYYFIKTPVTLFTFIFVIFIILKILKECKIKTLLDKNIFLFMIVIILPILWYMFTSNHSDIHCWFTCKALCVSFFAFLSYLMLVYERKIK